MLSLNVISSEKLSLPYLKYTSSLASVLLPMDSSNSTVPYCDFIYLFTAALQCNFHETKVLSALGSRQQ